MVEYAVIDALTTGQTITEAIWDKVRNDATLHQSALAVYYLNNTGVALAQGDVVVLDDAADGEVVTTTTIGDARKVGVVQDAAINIGALGWFAIHGHVPLLKVAGTIARQVDLQTSATAKAAQAGAGNTFGVTLTGRTGAGTIEAFIHNAGVSSAHVIKDLDETFAQRANLRFGDGLNVVDVPGSDETLISSGWPVEVVSATHGPAGFHIIDATAHTNEIGAPGPGFALVITKIAIWNRVATANTVTVSENGGGGYSAQPTVGAVIGAGTVDAYQGGWQLQEDTGVDIQCSVVGDVFIEIEFFTKAV